MYNFSFYEFKELTHPRYLQTEDQEYTNRLAELSLIEYENYRLKSQSSKP